MRLTNNHGGAPSAAERLETWRRELEYGAGNLDLRTLEGLLDRTLSIRTKPALRHALEAGSWIYGAGGFGRRVASVLTAHGYPVRGFIDRRGSVLEASVAKPVVSPDEFADPLAQGSNFVFGVHSVANIRDIYDFAGRYAFNDIINASDLADAFDEVLDNYWLTTRRFLKNNFGRLHETLRFFDDAASREIFLQIVHHRITGFPHLHPTVDLKNQYIPNDLPPLEGAITFVDGGAFTGDTVKQFIAAGIEVKKWIAFEPDPDNLGRISDLADSLPFETVVAPCGLSDVNQLVSFSANGDAASKIVQGSDEGASTIQCLALDSFIHGTKVDFIKLDIEGAEMAALTGMKHTIGRQRPRLAISAYHKPQDIWAIPEAITKLLPDSRLFVRQHGENGFDTVVYGIPSEHSRRAPPGLRGAGR
jgi:FkbM family methyltransferase